MPPSDTTSRFGLIIMTRPPTAATQPGSTSSQPRAEVHCQVPSGLNPKSKDGPTNGASAPHAPSRISASPQRSRPSGPQARALYRDSGNLDHLGHRRRCGERGFERPAGHEREAVIDPVRTRRLDQLVRFARRLAHAELEGRPDRAGQQVPAAGRPVGQPEDDPRPDLGPPAPRLMSPRSDNTSHGSSTSMAR